MNIKLLLEEWQQWEANMILDDKAWPKNEMTINGAHYEKMLELQEKRNVAIKYLSAPDFTCSKCQMPLSKCRCGY